MRLNLSRSASKVALSLVFAAFAPACGADAGAESHEGDVPREAVGITSQAITAAFGNQTVYDWNNGVTNVFTGDFNGDGIWDIGVTGTQAEGDRRWYIRYGDGKGNFVNQTVYAWGNGTTNIFTGDFNGDGFWDIGATGTDTEGDHAWYIRYGDGTGNFGNETVYPWGNTLTNIFTGDFNGDGKWDIGITGTASQGDHAWYIRYGDGTGNFGNETVYPWGNTLTAIFTGDFDGDGKWDIGVTGTQAEGDHSWYIRYGDGMGGFANQTVYPWNNGATNVFTGDFNGDHLWDLGVTGMSWDPDRNWYVRYNLSPAPAPYGDEATVTVGYHEACALKPDRTVQCWGVNVDGYLAASPSGKFLKISTGSGGDGSCGIRPDHTLSCWASYWGSYSNPPSGTYSDITVGRTFACALRMDGTIACWGDNSAQQTQAPSGQFLGLAARMDFACGIRSDLSLACWGYYASLFGLTSVPAGQFKQVAVAGWNACAIKLDGTLACWGKYGTASTPPGTFTRIAGFDGPDYDYDTMCGIRTDGSIACWYDGAGTIGTTVGGTYTQIGGGDGALCAVDTSGHVTCPETIYYPEARQNIPAGLVAKTSL